jgi:hypothetical protein
MIELQTILLQVNIWELLKVFGTIFTPIIVLILTAFGHLLWWFHKRLNTLEEGQTQVSRTVYGDKEDSRSAGLSQEISEIQTQIESIDEALDVIERREEIRKIREERED